MRIQVAALSGLAVVAAVLLVMRSGAPPEGAFPDPFEEPGARSGRAEDAEPSPAGATRGARSAAEETLRPASPATPSDASEPLAVEAGGRLLLDAASLPAEGPVVVRLALPESSPGSGPLGARLLSRDGKPRTLASRASGDGPRSAVVEIDPKLLTPGRHMVEVRTGERSHFPARRFVIEVR